MDDETPRPTRATREAVIAAAARLLNEEGAGAFTTRSVAAAAGVQAPAIYRLFGDKQGLVDAVARDVMTRYVAGKTSATAPADPVTALQEAWRSHVGFGLANPVLYDLMTSRDHRPDPDAEPGPDLIEAGADVLRGHVRRLAEAGLLRVSEQRAVDVVHAAGHGVVLALLERPRAQRDAALSETVLDAVLHAVLVQPAAATSPDRTPLAASVALVGVLGDLPGLTDAERTLLAEWMRRVIAELSRTGGQDEH